MRAMSGSENQYCRTNAVLFLSLDGQELRICCSSSVCHCFSQSKMVSECETIGMPREKGGMNNNQLGKVQQKRLLVRFLVTNAWKT